MTGNPGKAEDWDAYSADVSARKDSPEWEVLRRARSEHYRRFFSVNPNAKVLDAGCGHGEYTIFALHDRARVWAIDASEKMLSYTRQAVEWQGLQAEEISCQSIMNLPYPSNNFDIVFNLSVLECVENPELALRELIRVLRPGGQLYLDVCNATAVHWHALFRIMQFLGCGPKGKMRYFFPRELSAMVRKAGCEPVDSSGQAFCPPFSGIYTPDLRRFTILPACVIRPLDKLYLAVERFANHRWPFRLFCWHYFLRSVKRPGLSGSVSAEIC